MQLSWRQPSFRRLRLRLGRIRLVVITETERRGLGPSLLILLVLVIDPVVGDLGAVVDIQETDLGVAVVGALEIEVGVGEDLGEILTGLGLDLVEGGIGDRDLGPELSGEVITVTGDLGLAQEDVVLLLPVDLGIVMTKRTDIETELITMRIPEGGLVRILS